MAQLAVMGLAHVQPQGWDSALRVSAEVGLAGLPGGWDARWAMVRMGADTTVCLEQRRCHTSPDPVLCPSVLKPALLPGAYLFSLCCFAELVHKLAHSHEHRQDQPCGQDDEDAPNLLDTQGTGLLVFLLRTPAATPPLLLHDVQLVLLLQLQDGDGDLVPVWGACSGRGWGGVP